MNFIMLKRSYSSNTSNIVKKSAKMIRNEFLDYFIKDLGHTSVQSSPVVPLNDQTIAFVNAGMNQFKGVFLDYHDPPAKKVANSQKCIRVGGKHNDLDVVGSDSYHHTFFEMLGNWSFGDYFKEEACRYAWDLLTKRYGIDKEFLYVTYFAGDEKLGLEADLECKEVWLNMGVSKDRIIPFGVQDNFWEMSVAGPCGPCTEIHIDHTKQITNQAVRINKGYADLTELWNIVFIQYERLTNGTIVPLSKHHVDTGLGFERLVSLLQEKESNYDTDLFQPLFKSIQKHAKAPEYKGRFHDDVAGLDTGYRILADHSRMITVALADGMVPEESNKLRKIIRKAINVGEKIFKKEEILGELSYIVAESLGDVYPELQNNLTKVQKILKFEQDLFKRIRNTSGKEWMKIVETRPELISVTDWVAPGLLNGYKYLRDTLKNMTTTKILSGSIAFKLYETYGLSVETIIELAEIESLSFDVVAFQNELNKQKYRSRIGLVKGSEVNIKESIEVLKNNHIPKTDDSFKYEYNFDGSNYQFPKIESKIVAFILNGHLLLNTKTESSNNPFNSKEIECFSKQSNEENQIGIILDKTLCYSLEGGQTSDKGFIRTKDLVLNITSVKKINNYVIHFVQSNPEILIKNLNVGDSCTVSINPEYRVGLMQHHTGAHLLNAALKNFLQVVYPRNSLILPHVLKYQFNSFGEKLSFEELKNIETLVNNVIRENVPITVKVLNSLELLSDDSVTLIPGEIYPYTGIRIIEVNTHNFKSKEACCGTHVSTTGQLEHFCFLNYSSKGASNLTVKAVVGPFATSAKLTGESIKRKIFYLEDKLKTEEISYEAFEAASEKIRNEIDNKDNETLIPYILREECSIKLKELNRIAWLQAKDIEMSSISEDIKRANNASCIVHCLSQNLMYLSLNEIISRYSNTPTLIISHYNGVIKARCSIPQEMASDKFNAQTWMKIVLEIFNAEYGPTKGSNPLLSCNMRSKNISVDSIDDLVQKAVKEAKTFASMRANNT